MSLPLSVHPIHTRLLHLQVGVKTPFANVVTSLFVTIVLCAATGLLKYVPQVRDG
jgi:MFS superfamily sulfate permease-like transporter